MVQNFAEEFGYQDVYLVDSENGDIVYSLRKRIDFALLSRMDRSQSTWEKSLAEQMQQRCQGILFADFEPTSLTSKANGIHGNTCFRGKS